jgi:flagellar biosynthesis component FlhA
LYDIAQAKLKEFKTMVETCREQLEAALAYGFKKNQENIKMLRYIKELEGKTEEGENNGKDRETEDTGL